MWLALQLLPKKKYKQIIQKSQLNAIGRLGAGKMAPLLYLPTSFAKTYALTFKNILLYSSTVEQKSTRAGIRYNNDC